MHNNIRLAVFDIAGTTVKDNGEIAIAFQQAFQQYGYTVPVEKINPLMGYKKPEAIDIMLQEYEQDSTLITPDYINAIHEYFRKLMVQYYTVTNDLQPLPGAATVFSWLKERGIRIALDTGFSNDITNVIIERLGWLRDGLVDDVVSSNEVKAGRPFPYMIQHLMRNAGVDDALQVIKTGDTEVDINEGKNAGCLLSVGVTTGAFTRAQLEPYEPSFIIDHLEELIPVLENNYQK